MKQILTVVLCVLYFAFAKAQTKIGGVVYEDNGLEAAFANVYFPDSTEGTITNDDGTFYIESDKNYDTAVISYLGYKDYVIDLSQDRTQTDLNITLESDAANIAAVRIYSGNISKKNNPAIELLRKVWANRRSNGLNMVDQYEYNKYEKIEFDLNSIDSSMVESRLFKGMEFIFDYADTSRITGKTYLPMFINESLSSVYGDNIIDKKKETLNANRNSGFSSNQAVINFVKDLYSEFDIYDNYLTFFDKNFVSPVGKAGLNDYNYVLSDTAVIDGINQFNIIYYPKRKNQLTFKGDFWVADSSYAITSIKLQGTKKANINWVKEIYIEQEFDIVNDSVFLLKRDYFLSDFALSKDADSKGIYGKRTTLYDNFVFDQEREEDFYKKEVYSYNPEVYERDESTGITIV